MIFGINTQHVVEQNESIIIFSFLIPKAQKGWKIFLKINISYLG
jgi:hypothetical protein